MGYPVQASAPQTIINGNTYAVGAFSNNSAMGLLYQIGVFALVGGGWNAVNIPFNYANPGDMTAAVQKAGGINQFIATIAPAINQVFAAHGFTAILSIPPTDYSQEPTTDDAAIADVVQVLSFSKFVGAVIPPLMRKDYDNYWAMTPNGNSQNIWGGSITKLAAALAVYCDPAGVFVPLCPLSDLNAIAKMNSHIEAAWKAAYGFVPL